EIVKEAPIYRRERTVNLGIARYMFSKIVILGILCLLQSAILVLAVHWIVPIQQGILLPVLFEVYIIMTITSITVLLLGLNFSNFSQEEATIHLLICWLALIVMILFLGIAIAYFLKRKDVRT